jgi:cytochrome b
MKVWDIYTRLWHWLLVLGIFFQWLSGEVLDSQMQNHALMGYTLLGMMIFRLCWGLIGPEAVRFTRFVPSWTTLRSYITKSNKAIFVSHNPLGALAVLAFIVLITLQAASGFFMEDEIFFTGPLYNWLSASTTSLIAEMHEIAFTGILLLIAIHIFAVIYHRFKHEPFIVKAMVTGNKPLTNPFQPLPTVQLHIRAWLCIAVSIIIVWLLVNHLPGWLGVEADFY